MASKPPSASSGKEISTVKVGRCFSIDSHHFSWTEVGGGRESPEVEGMAKW